MLLLRLDGVGILEQLLELALLALQLRVAANVLLADEDVGHGTLVGHLLEGVLDGGTVICSQRVSMVLLVLDVAYVVAYQSGRAQGCRPLRQTR